MLFGLFFILNNFYRLDQHNETCVTLTNLQLMEASTKIGLKSIFFLLWPISLAHISSCHHVLLDGRLFGKQF